jgi:hypothetical protein
VHVAGQARPLLFAGAKQLVLGLADLVQLAAQRLYQQHVVQGNLGLRGQRLEDAPVGGGKIVPVAPGPHGPQAAHLALERERELQLRRGGFGLVREITVLTDVTMTIHGDREKFTPFGIAGGLNAGGSMLIINKGTNQEINAGMYATGVELKAGDRIYYSSAGGGGFGDPLEREPELVLADVMDEWLSIEAADEYYGVVIKEIDADACVYEIDEAATKKRRAELAKKGFEEGTGAYQVHPQGKDIKPAWIPTEEEVKPHITVSRPPGW